jgi:hypothetical protein
METTTPATPGSPEPTRESERVGQFKSDVAGMKVKTGNAGRERVYGVLGLLIMLVGVGGAFFCYVSSTNLADPRDIQSTLILAVGFVCVTLLGLGLFVRFAFANFLRMWLLRQLYEDQANTQKIVDALNGRG